MSAPIPLDEPCPCGSGELYRDCCGRRAIVKRRQRRNLIIGLIVLAAAGIPVFLYLNRLDDQKREDLTLPPGATYSEEHHHWHDANGQELKIPGYVWSMTQQKWLKVTDTLIDEMKAEDERDQSTHYKPIEHRFTDMPEPITGVSQPDATAPPGKIWSPEHGHYHDLDSN